MTTGDMVRGQATKKTTTRKFDSMLLSHTLLSAAGINNVTVLHIPRSG